MEQLANPESADPQGMVNAYFSRTAYFWERTYTADGIQDAIHQERLLASLAMVDELRLTSGARALDVGCGAGFAAVSLAQRGVFVEALDAVQDMIDATRRRAAEAKLASRVTTRIGDVHALPFRDGTFDLVLALGLLPWLPRAEEPLREMSRVLRPGGHLIVSVDTRWQFRDFFEPLSNPVLRRPHRLVRHLLRRLHLRKPLVPRVETYPISLRAFRRALGFAGLEERKGIAIGFGPFRVFNYELLPASLGMKLHHRLQAMAKRNVPIIRCAGCQYLAIVKKRGVAEPRADIEGRH